MDTKEGMKQREVTDPWGKMQARFKKANYKVAAVTSLIAEESWPKGTGPSNDWRACCSQIPVRPGVHQV